MGCKIKKKYIIISLLYRVYVFSILSHIFYPVLLNEENTFAESFKFFLYNFINKKLLSIYKILALLPLLYGTS